MSDVTVLYAVTAVVLFALLAWAGYVLVTAEDAPDESPVEPRKGDEPGGPLDRRSPFDETTKLTRKVIVRDETPPPSIVDVAVPSERAVAIGGTSAPVVLLPVMRSRLDSHSEIRDSSAAAPEEQAPAPEESTRAPESIVPPGPPLSIVSAVGKAEPASGPTEMSAIVDRQRLFILADGGGQRVQNELVSAVVSDALAAAFEAGADATYPADATLPRRADRLRRAVRTALEVLGSRGKGEPLDKTRVGVLAAHFSPDNRRLFISTVGADRAYRLRGQDVTHLNKAPMAAGADGAEDVNTVVFETAPDDVYVFGTDKAFLALGDELRAVLTFDPSIDRVAAHFVAAATREAKSTGMTAIVVRVNPPRVTGRPAA
jgi:serine/threonine protein phosphatase PrpC